MPRTSSVGQLDHRTIVMLYYSAGTEAFGAHEVAVCVRCTKEQYVEAMEE